MEKISKSDELFERLNKEGKIERMPPIQESDFLKQVSKDSKVKSAQSWLSAKDVVLR